MKFSVLMSAYRNDNAADFRTAVESISVKQICKPAEIVIVVDGPVPEGLECTIKDLEHDIPEIRVRWLSENGGLGNAMNIGMQLCSFPLVARMDADDISLPDRFEKQIAFMERNPEIAALGGQISEFIGSPENIIGQRKVPLSPIECREYYKNRDPLNHVSVMLRKNAVMTVGNYQAWHLDEDTYLWGRLLKGGYDIANLPDTLVNVRVGEQMYARRGGWKYFKSDMKIIAWKRKNGLTSNAIYYFNWIVRFSVYVVMPNRIRGWFFKNILRKK